MKCDVCGSENVQKVENEKFLTTTYKCEKGHEFEVISKTAKTAAAGGILAAIGGIVATILMGGKR